MTDSRVAMGGNMQRKPNPTDIHVGQRLRAARVLAGMSQERLGATVGLSFQQIQKYEKGHNRIGASRMQQLAQALNIPPSYFFDQSPTDPAALPAVSNQTADAAAVSRRQSLDLVRYFSSIPDETMRDALFKLVKVCGQAEDEAALAAEAAALAAAPAAVPVVHAAE